MVEEVCHWGQTLTIHSLYLLAVYSLCFYFLGSFLYLPFKFCFLSWLHSSKLPIPSPSPCFYVYPTHPLPSSIPLHWVIKPSQVQGLIFQLMSHKAILCYLCSWSHGSLLSWWFSHLSSGASDWLILVFKWGCRPLQILQSFF